jgi:hypothetical protein
MEKTEEMKKAVAEELITRDYNRGILTKFGFRMRMLDAGFSVDEVLSKARALPSPPINKSSPVEAVAVKGHDWQKTSNDLVMWVCEDCKLALPGNKPGFTKPHPFAHPVCAPISNPVAWRVVAEPDLPWHFCRNREEAEHTAKNLLTYRRGCTSARVEPLYATPPAPTSQPIGWTSSDFGGRLEQSHSALIIKEQRSSMPHYTVPVYTTPPAPTSAVGGEKAQKLAEHVLTMTFITDAGLRARDLARAVLGIGEVKDDNLVYIITNGTLRVLPVDEPVFLIRAQDKLAGDVVMHYSHMAEIAGCSTDHVEQVRSVAEAMWDWAATHKTKLPDWPPRSHIQLWNAPSEDRSDGPDAAPVKPD